MHQIHPWVEVPRLWVSRALAWGLSKSILMWRSRRRKEQIMVWCHVMTRVSFLLQQRFMQALRWMLLGRETSCFRWSMSLCCELGFHALVFETNCRLLFQAWTTTASTNSYVGSILEDCKLLSWGFSYMDLSHVNRQCNQVADFM